MRLRTSLLLALVILAGAALRLTLIGDLPPGLYPDEATNGTDALRAIESGNWQWFYESNNGREGLFINVQALSIMAAGVQEPWVLRIVSAIVGILTIPGMYLLGRTLWSKRVGLISAALLAGSFWHLIFSRMGFRAIAAPLMLAWAMVFIVLALQRAGASKKSAAWLALLGGAVAGLGVHTYIAFRAAAVAFLVTCVAAFWIAAKHRKDVFKLSILAGAAALLVASPVLWYFYSHPGTFAERSAQVSVFAQPDPVRNLVKNTGLELGMLFLKGDGNWRHNFPPQPEMPRVFFPFLLIGAAEIIRKLVASRGKDLTGITVIGLTAAALLPAITSSEGMPHALRGIMLLVPVLLTTGLGIATFWRFIEARGWRVAGATLATCVVLYGFWYTAARYPAYAARIETYYEFAGPSLALGREIRDERDKSRDAYIIVPEGNLLAGGIPISAQTVAFITGTATPEGQQRERIFYTTRRETVPEGAQFYYLR